MAAVAACTSQPAPSPSPSPAATPTQQRATEAETAAEPTERQSPQAQQRRPPLARVQVGLEPVVELESPIALATRAGDDTLYVAERAGRVRAVRDGQVADEPVLDISDTVSTGSERGLLGIAFAPDGGELYASYTNADGNSRLVAYPMDGNAAARDRGRRLLGVDQPYGNHNGGDVAVGPDGMLYWGLGDGGSGGDPHGNGQDPSTLLGKLVRVDADGSAPRDNPFVGRDGYAPEIFALGLRNPWRFSFDRETDALWVADVGQNSIEEINRVPFGRAGGRNFGWNIFEGSEAFAGGDAPQGVVWPVVEYPTAEGCAVTGGYVYRGSQIPELQGAYLYSDYCAGGVRAVRVEDGDVTDEADLGVDVDAVVSFGQDGDGELYVLSLDGPVVKIVPAGS